MQDASTRKSGTVIYFSHGGGPLPILGDPSHAAMIDFMQNLPEKIIRPDSVIVISAHWEEKIPTVLGHASPPLFYDYYGFPEEAYELKYPVPGNPELAHRITTLLTKAGIQSAIDKDRGFDHGLFIPLKMMYPEADIPMTQISLIRGLKPQDHISLGKALRNLLGENILIIGSGFSFHNMRAFNWNNTVEQDPENDQFQEWLIDTCTGNHPQTEREEMLLGWDAAPGARYCHPREEHLMPLHVCSGATCKAAEIIFDDFILGKRSIGLKW
jgi:aromatic ring-opening dioxygenase catalytic subunit (LigB family)